LVASAGCSSPLEPAKTETKVSKTQNQHVFLDNLGPIEASGPAGLLRKRMLQHRRSRCVERIFTD